MSDTQYEWRNPVYNRFGTIDMEINHPKQGWIPTTTTPDDAEEYNRNLYAKALAAGNIAPYVAPPIEEQRQWMSSLSARQFRLGLIMAGSSPSAVSALINAMPAGPDKENALVEWEYATTFTRLHPLVVTLSTALGFTPEQVDSLWEQALTI